jgi:hypothetical protein
MFTGAVQSSFHCRHGDAQRLGDLAMAAPLLDQRQEHAVLGSKLGERMPKGIEFFGVDRPLGLRDVLVFRAEWKEDPPQLLPTEVVDAGVARQAKEPGLKLLGGLKFVQGADHFDKYLLSNIFHRIAAAGYRIDEPGDPTLISLDKLRLGRLVTALGAADEIDQSGR